MLSVLLTALAAFYAVILLRKLPGFRQLDERGIKPVACDVCMAFWATLGWQLTACLADTSCTWGWLSWAEWSVQTAAAAGVTFLLLCTYRWAKFKLGSPDFEKPVDYTPPAGG